MKLDSLQKIYRRAKQTTKYAEAVIIIVAAFKECQDAFNKFKLGLKMMMTLQAFFLKQTLQR